jgi:hypothetical protein
VGVLHLALLIDTGSGGWRVAEEELMKPSLPARLDLQPVFAKIKLLT